MGSKLSNTFLLHSCPPVVAAHASVSVDNESDSWPAKAWYIIRQQNEQEDEQEIYREKEKENEQEMEQENEQVEEYEKKHDKKKKEQQESRLTFARVSLGLRSVSLFLLRLLTCSTTREKCCTAFRPSLACSESSTSWNRRFIKMNNWICVNSNLLFCSAHPPGVGKV